MWHLVSFVEHYDAGQSVDTGVVPVAGVEGFGNAADDEQDKRKKHAPAASTYDPSSEISVLGFGGVGKTQRAYLSKEAQSRLGKI